MWKRLLALVLSLALVLCGCGSTANTSQNNVNVSEANNPVDNDKNDNESDDVDEDNDSNEEGDFDSGSVEEYKLEFNSLEDENLLSYLEDNVYEELVQSLNSEGYFVSNVEAIYISKEYLEEKEYNSRSNIFFGYKLEDIEKAYAGSRYVFTVNDEGRTIVTAFEDYDDTYDKIIKNVAIGTGVILLCVTVSVVTGGAGAPAASMIFAMSAKTGTIMALSSAGIGGLAAGITTHMQTGDIDQALKAAALEGSEQFKWGAIIGAVAGGATEFAALKGATLNGLTMNEAATIQKETGYPLELIREFKSMEEYELYKNAGLTTEMINGRLALVREIDPNYISPLSDGKSNLELMIDGNAPFDPLTNTRYELHHINQNRDGVLAIMKNSEHSGNYSILHDKAKNGVHNALTGDKLWKKKKAQFWKEFANRYK